MKVRPWALAISIATGITAIGGAAAMLNYDLDRPAWYSELQEVAGRTLRHELRMLKRDRYEILRGLNKYRAAEQQPPRGLLDQLRWVESRIKNIERRLARRG